VRLGAGLNQLKLVSSAEDEGGEGVKAVENTEGEDEDVHSEYRCSVTVSDDSNAGLATSLRVGGRSEEVGDGGVGYEDEVGATASELLS